MAIRKTTEVKFRIKPVFFNLEHEGPHPERAQDITSNSSYEGPCRLGDGELLTNDFDKKAGAEKFKIFKENLDGYPDYVEIINPVYLYWTDGFVYTNMYYEKLKDDLGNSDFLLAEGVLHQYPILRIAKSAGIASGIIACCSTDFSAGARKHGIESYAFVDHEHTIKYMRLLRAKKAFKTMKVLYIVQDMVYPYGTVSNAELTSLSEIHGIDSQVLNAETLFDAVRNLTHKQEHEAVDKARELADGASWNKMTEDNIRKSCRLYVTVKGLLEKYDCNAFTMPCHEVCATRLFNDEFKFTPCLTHSLLKEDGIPSGCELDLNCLLGISILENLTGTAPHMGNTGPYFEPDKSDMSVPNGLPLLTNLSKEDKDNVFYTFHAVQTRKEKGLNSKNSKYGIQSFTVSGWGATIRPDMSGDIGETITLVRFSPDVKKMIVIKGDIIAISGNEDIGCATGFYWKCKDGRDAFWKQQNFGHHLAWTYGDHVRDLQELGDMIGVEVITS